MPLVGLTAWQALFDHGKLTAGQRMLINGAGGAVGGYAVQLAKEVGAILATASGPLVAASLTAATGSWWPIAAMLVVYSLITLVSAALAPEVQGRDLVRLEDAA